MAVAVLSPVLGSLSGAVTLAVLVRSPAELGVTTMVTVALSPLARLPMAQMTGPVPLHVPGLAEEETKLTPPGRVSVRVTWLPVEGPLLLTTTV